MACKVKVNRHGFLAFRFYWNGREFWQGTGWRDTPKNRIKAEGKALEITEEIKARTFNYLKWFPKGNKAHLSSQWTPSHPTAPLHFGNFTRSG